MRDIYLVTMWTGGRPAKKWKTYEEPTVLAQGTGVEFVSLETKLKVRVVGNVSVEQFESGKEELEFARSHGLDASYPNIFPKPEDDGGEEEEPPRGKGSGSIFEL